MTFLKILITLPYFLRIFTKARSMSRKIKRDPNLVTEEYRYKWLKKRAHYVLWLKSVKIVPHNIENWEDKGCLMVGNHQTLWDPAIMFELNNFDKHAPNAFIAKKELKTDRKFKKFTSLIDVLFLDRDNPRQALSLMNEAIDLVRVPRSIVLFPEGTRSNCPQMGEFKNGFLKIAQKAHVAILPFSIANSYQLSKGSGFKKHYIHVVFHKPFKPQNILNKPTEILGNQLKTIIQKGIDEYANVSYKDSERMFKEYKRKLKEKD